jgi:CBS domain-containing protein
MRCAELMKQDVIYGRIDQSVRWAAQRMREARIGFLPVVDDEHRLVGVLTDRDIVLRVTAECLDPGLTLLGQVISRDPVTCRPDEPLTAAEERMAEHHKARIPVVDEEGRLQGVISLSDLAQVDLLPQAGAILQKVCEREATPQY